MSSESPAFPRLLTYMIVVTLALLGLHVYGEILLPFLFSVIISIALLPIAQWLERKGLKRALSSLLSLILLIVVLAGLSTFYFFQFKEFAETLPQIGSTSVINSLSDQMDGKLNLQQYFSLDEIKKQAGSLLKASGNFVGNTFLVFSDFFSFLFLVPIYIFFMLVSRGHIRAFIQLRYQNKRKEQMKGLLNSIQNGMSSYFKGLGMVIVIVGVLNSVGLLIIGIDYAILLGTFSAFLIIIPYFGVFIGALIPIAIALVTKDSLTYPIAVAALYAVVQFLEGNVITPKLMSTTVNINPLVVIMSLIFMGFVSGILGMIVAVPLMVIINLIFKSSEQLADYSVLLED